MIDTHSSSTQIRMIPCPSPSLPSQIFCWTIFQRFYRYDGRYQTYISDIQLKHFLMFPPLWRIGGDLDQRPVWHNLFLGSASRGPMCDDLWTASFSIFFWGQHHSSLYLYLTVSLYVIFVSTCKCSWFIYVCFPLIVSIQVSNEPNPHWDPRFNLNL